MPIAFVGLEINDGSETFEKKILKYSEHSAAEMTGSLQHFIEN
jgi:hypothetical protein